MKSFLKPLNTNQKSFYGKAQVIDLDNDVYGLKSYDTIVCIIDYQEKGVTKITFPWGEWSNTTAKHVREFLIQEHISIGEIIKNINEKNVKNLKQLMENIRYVEFGREIGFYYDDDMSREKLQYVNNFINNYV